MPTWHSVVHDECQVITFLGELTVYVEDYSITNINFYFYNSVKAASLSTMSFRTCRQTVYS